MVGASQHLEWLSLVEVSGPFLAASVLDVAFPQGLESIDSSKRQRIRAAYEEWQDAVDQQDPLLADLHAEWIRLILVDLLEYEPESLLPAAAWPGDPSFVTSDDGTLSFAPTWIIQSPSTKQVRTFVTVVPPGTDLESIGPQATWTTTLRERMTALCRSRGVQIGLLTNGERWMVVNAPADSTSGQASWYARLWSQEPLTLRAFQGLLSVRRCFGPAEGTLEELLEESIKHQDEVTTTLGEQVRRAVEVLIQALDRADEDRDRDLLRETTPAELYEAGLTVMMRLVFVLCAEERGLLLLGDPLYDEAYAVSTLRGQLADEADRHGPEVLERRHDAWSRLLALFRVIFAGVDHEDMRLPAMGGSLFDPDRFPFLEGRAAGTCWTDTRSVPVPIDNRTVLLLLTSLQVLEQAGGALNLSYRALDVEQIGYVYEGLLEHTVVRVPQITIGLKGSSKRRYPNLPLSELESARMSGDERLAGVVEQATGRSASAIRTDIDRAVPRETRSLILDAVGGDQSLSCRVEPFANLLRLDARGEPIIHRQGAFMVAGGTERRETGTHYTPKSLTEEIVQTTLEPTVYAGPSEGLGRNDWVLKSPEDLLALKICDPAMGSGAFLVQACRYLADRVVEAWSLSEERGNRVLVSGTVVSGDSTDELLSSVPDERQIAARRLVAERCLYGVDVNPMAVELAKLSIWLVTLAKGRPFDFLDHSLRAGDSLLGVHDLRQLGQLNLQPGDTCQPSIFGERVEDAVADAVSVRLRLRDVVVRDITDVEALARLNAQAQGLIDPVERVADCLAGEAIDSVDSPTQLTAASARLALWADQIIGDDEHAADQLRARVTWLMTDGIPSGTRPRRPFHWALEFPEVFSAGGFHAIIGNPPFLGNRLWRSMLGTKMQAQAKVVLGTPPGKIDLCVVFHRRAVQLLRKGGCYGLLGRDNMTEGSAINAGLGAIVAENDIFYARKRVPWPGKASVVVALVCCIKGEWKGSRLLDGAACDRIGPRFEPEAESAWTAKKLSDAPFAFAGVDNSKGLAFVLTPVDPWCATLRDEPNSLLRPYVSGNDITEHSLQRVSRWALDLADRNLDEIRDGWPKAYEFLVREVKPTRTAGELKSYKGLIDRWWQFWNHRAPQMRKLRRSEKFIAFPKAAKYPFCLLAPTGWLYTNKVALVSWSRADLHAVCLSSFFRQWLHSLSVRSLGADPNTVQLSISEAISTYPLPRASVDEAGIGAALEFDSLVQSWSVSNNSGLTAMLNLVNSPDCQSAEIQRARHLLAAIDQAVATAYQWDDLDLTATFRAAGDSSSRAGQWDISESAVDSVKGRLLDLNESAHHAASAPGKARGSWNRLKGGRQGA